MEPELKPKPKGVSYHLSDVNTQRNILAAQVKASAGKLDMNTCIKRMLRRVERYYGQQSKYSPRRDTPKHLRRKQNENRK